MPSMGVDARKVYLATPEIGGALGGAMYGQYQMYIGPDIPAGLGWSLNIVFACIAAGLWTLLGQTFGAVLPQLLAEFLRVAVQRSVALQSVLGSRALALDTTIYGLLPAVFIIYMPKGILGTLIDRWSCKRWC